MSSIVLEPGVKDMLLADCRDFLRSEDWYAERGQYSNFALSISFLYKYFVQLRSQYAGVRCINAAAFISTLMSFVFFSSAHAEMKEFIASLAGIVHGIGVKNRQLIASFSSNRYTVPTWLSLTRCAWKVCFKLSYLIW